MPDLLKAYLEHLPEGASRTYEGTARMFCKWLTNRKAACSVIDEWVECRARGDLVTEDLRLRFNKLVHKAIEDWMQHRLLVPYKPGSVKHSFGVLRSMFVVNGLGWPFRRGEGPQIGERDEYKPSLEMWMEPLIRASAKLQPRHRAFLALSSIYGLRRGEIQEIGLHSFDWESGLVYVKTEKHGRERYHLIPEEIMPHLKAYEWPRVSASGVSVVFQALKAAAGISHEFGKRASYHGIRHAIDAVFVDAGWSEFNINKYMRWKDSSQSMPRRYASRTVLGLDSTRVEVGIADADLDRRAFELLPWLPVWKEIDASG